MSASVLARTTAKKSYPVARPRAYRESVILQKAEEGVVAHAHAQVFHEVRAVQVRGIGVCAERAAIIDRRVHIPASSKIVHAELPPPIAVARIVVLVKIRSL